MSAVARCFEPDDSLAPPVELPKMDLSRLLTCRADAIASAWRRAYSDHLVDPLAELGQIDGIIESLVEELGYSLEQQSDLPAAAWGRICGVLRLSAKRGESGLEHELALLRMLLEQAAEQVGAAISERKRLRILLDAAQAQAMALLRQRISPNAFRPGVAFGGVVLEVA